MYTLNKDHYYKLHKYDKFIHGSKNNYIFNIHLSLEYKLCVQNKQCIYTYIPVYTYIYTNKARKHTADIKYNS